MFDQQHIEELTTRHLERRNCDVTASAVEIQLQEWVKEYGSIDKVYTELCNHFGASPRYRIQLATSVPVVELKVQRKCVCKHSMMAKGCECGAQPKYNVDKIWGR